VGAPNPNSGGTRDWLRFYCRTSFYPDRTTLYYYVDDELMHPESNSDPDRVGTNRIRPGRGTPNGIATNPEFNPIPIPIA
jgi:hypothetical protein